MVFLIEFAGSSSLWVRGFLQGPQSRSSNDPGFINSNIAVMLPSVRIFPFSLYFMQDIRIRSFIKSNVSAGVRNVTEKN